MGKGYVPEKVKYFCPVCFVKFSARALHEHIAEHHLQHRCLQIAHCPRKECKKKRDIFSVSFLTEHLHQSTCNLIFPQKDCSHRVNCQILLDTLMNISLQELGPITNEGRIMYNEDRLERYRQLPPECRYHQYIKGTKMPACFVKEHQQNSNANGNSGHRLGSGSAFNNIGRSTGVGGGGRSTGHDDGGRSPGYRGGDRSSVSGGGGRSPGYRGGGRSPGYGGGGNRSPGYGGGRRSLGYGDGGRSPGYGDGGRSPGYGDGGRSPGYGDGGRSPGYGDGGRSPGYGGGGRSPGYGGGDRSPGYGGGGDRSPGYGGGSRSPGYGGDRSPGYGDGGRSPGYGGGDRSPGYGGGDGSPGYGGGGRSPGYGGGGRSPGYGGGGRSPGYGGGGRSPGYGGSPVGRCPGYSEQDRRISGAQCTSLNSSQPQDNEASMLAGSSSIISRPTVPLSQNSQKECSGFSIKREPSELMKDAPPASEISLTNHSRQNVRLEFDKAHEVACNPSAQLSSMAPVTSPLPHAVFTSASNPPHSMNGFVPSRVSGSYAGNISSQANPTFQIARHTGHSRYHNHSSNNSLTPVPPRDSMDSLHKLLKTPRDSESPAAKKQRPNAEPNRRH